MNPYQRLVIVTAVMNGLIIVLFPPFSSISLARGILPSFDGFFPIFGIFAGRQIYLPLLLLELIFVAINALAACLALQSKRHHGDLPEFAFIQGIALFSLANFMLIFAFPPFEPYHSLLKGDSGGFDSFYFLFGSRSQRAIYWPMLTLECLFILVNALGHCLLFSAIKRSENQTRAHLLELAAALPDSDIKPLTAALERRLDSLAHTRPLDRQQPDPPASQR